MTPYASRTGTKRNLAALRRAGWRLFVSATGVWRHEGFPYAIDNGAWTAHQKGEEWNRDLFLGVLKAMGDEADFIVAPDIVAGGLDSLERTLEWLPRLESYRLVLIPVQDGIEASDVESHLSDRVGIFLGGSTEWKERTIPLWGRVARRARCYYHVGRVNSKRRIYLCSSAGADSFDGSSASMFAMKLPLLDGARRQISFVFDD